MGIARLRGRGYWVLSTVLLTAACGDGGEPAPLQSATDTAAGAENAPAQAVPMVPDACTFFDRDWLERAVGWELRDGDPDDMPPGMYACDFETPPLMYVTREYPDPPLPASVGFSSVTVSTHPSNPEQFEEFRKTLGQAASNAPGIGDAAYFYGFDMLYVRVGNRGFSLRIYTDAQTDEDRARVGNVLQEVAREGARKLRS